jgi:hypothetical protein
MQDLELKGSRFQPWQDFMHMQTKKLTKYIYCIKLCIAFTIPGGSWLLPLKRMLLTWEDHPPPMVYNSRLKHPLIFVQLPILVLLVRTRSGCQEVGFYLWVSCSIPVVGPRSLPKWPNLQFSLPRSITESQNRMETKWIEICWGKTLPLTTRH